MVLLIICLLIVLAVGIFSAVIEYYERGLAFLLGVMISGTILGGILLVVNIVGYQNTKVVTDTTYPINLASLNDGTGINGQIYGGLFLTRGYVEDTQHYSYYAKNDNGSFNLQKRPAEQSTIWQDATPETAKVDITDTITTCTPRWWLLCDPAPMAEFKHADFHVPAGSIGTDYKLDAQ